MNTERLEGLVQKVRSLPDSNARDAALELVQAVMELHATGLDRMMEIVAASENSGALLHSFSEDSGISAILLLHNLHPIDFETRVRRAVDQPSLRGRGARVDLVSIRDGVVHVRVEGGPAFETAVRTAIIESAPDVTDIVVDAIGAHAANGFVPLTQLLAR